ncbi:BolA family protein [Pseudomonadota bacterium AL_CKDN230030165-1A_HGKHYDSX7]
MTSDPSQTSLDPLDPLDRLEIIRARLAPLAPLQLEIEDESHLHAGHAGARGGAAHYRVLIVSDQFTGLRPVARHRLVYDRLQDLMPFPIHALALDAQAPSSK